MLKFSTKACGGILPNHCYKPFFIRVWRNDLKDQNGTINLLS